MIVNKKSIYTSRLVSDLVLLNLSFIISAILAQSLQTLLDRDYMFILLLLLNIVWFVNANLSGFYLDFFTRSFSFQFFNILKTTLFQVGLTVLFIFLTKEDLFTRNFILLYGLFLTLSISLRTAIFKNVLISLRRKGKNIRNLLVIGAEEVGKNFKETITRNPDFGYHFSGFLDNTSKDDEVIGVLDQLDEKIKEKEIDEVIITLSSQPPELLDEIIRVCNINAVRIHIIPDYFRFLSSRFQISSIGNFPIITARQEPLEEANRRFLKRTFDIIFSSIVLIFLLSWLYPILALLIKLDSKGKVLFIQKRVGVKNDLFECYKFRTLSSESSRETEIFKPVLMGDKRVTGIGNFLRKSNIDELPQFFNVLKGDMSVVGPRPHAIPYQDLYGKIFEEIKMRHNVRPGVTGWAQVNGLRGDIEDEKENNRRTIMRMKYDLWYIENWTMRLDLQIILMTIWQMIKGDTKAV
ncbi:MAG: exopolysaccharide biosynthesis polyprenyl glycosylphosphotransferase [Ignavibacterium sp.]|nr:exopolysaccharide biosynthesis polyprenyl glycosylphosphotransferase [Ignavibacterium sp.]